MRGFAGSLFSALFLSDVSPSGTVVVGAFCWLLSDSPSSVRWRQTTDHHSASTIDVISLFGRSHFRLSEKSTGPTRFSFCCLFPTVAQATEFCA